MSSEVEICNLALSHLGDSATVASIDPPEASAQAEHCARWYPIARNALLEKGEWNFATTRGLLVELVNPFTQWRHAYALPTECVKVLSVLPSAGTGDQGYMFERDGCNTWPQEFRFTALEQGFTTETDYATGNQIILANQGDAMVRYTRLVKDTTKFSPLFVIALARMLASFLAGPVLKGETGIKVGIAQMQIADTLLSQAAVSGANQANRQQDTSYPWSR